MISFRVKYVFKKKRYVLLATFIDLFGYFILWLSRLPKPARPFADRRFMNILIVRIDHLGDVLLSAGVPKMIKEHYPEARLTFLTSSWAAPLLEGNPFIDQVLTYDAPWFVQKRYERKVSGHGFFETARLLRKKRFDLGIGLRGDIRENFLLWLSGVSERIGYGITGGGFFLTKEVHYRERIHEKDRLVNLLRPLGIRTDSFQNRIYLSHPERLSVSANFSVMNLSAANRLVGFQYGAGAPSKDWPAHEANLFLKRFGEEFLGFKVVLVGTRTDSDGLREARQLAHCVDLVGKTSLRELCSLMTRFDLFIGPDSGPTHIASVLGVPTLFLFSGTNRFEEWRPLADSASVLRRPVPCSPCGLRFCEVKGHPCMSEIRANQVLEAVRSRLAPLSEKTN